MRKTLMLLSMLLIASMLLMACGAEGTEEPGVDLLPTDEVMTDEPMATEEAIPVTGDENPALLENQLDYDVWNGENDQIGEVEDMVIDLANSRVSYIHIETGGFLDIGDEDSLVPWNGFTLAINADQDPLTADDNVFILQFDQNLLEDAPDFDPNALPTVGDPAGDWDAEFNDYWGNAGVNVEPMAGAGANELEGVILATNLLGANVFFDQDADMTGIDIGDDELNIDTVMVDPNTGQVQFVVLDAAFEDGARLIPVTLNNFRWDGDRDGLVFTADPVRLLDAPFYTEDEPDTFEEGWENEYNSFWQ